jgi:hypothetical protein
MFIQLPGSIVVLVHVVILGHRVTQGWDDIGFLAPVHLLLFSQFGASLGVFAPSGYLFYCHHSLSNYLHWCKGNLTDLKR